MVGAVHGAQDAVGDVGRPRNLQEMAPAAMSRRHAGLPLGLARTGKPMHYAWVESPAQSKPSADIVGRERRTASPMSVALEAPPARRRRAAIRRWRSACSARSRARCCSTPFDRGRYSTDASIYQIEPQGVVVPRTDADVQAALAIAREEGVPVIAARRRHLAGRPDRRRRPGHRLLASIWTEVVELDPDARTVVGRARRRARPAEPLPQAARPVLPGRHLDQQPRDARRHGGQQRLRRALDPLRHHGRQLLAIDALLADGEPVTVRRGPGQPRDRSPTPERYLELIQRHARPRRPARPTRSPPRFPKVLRRVGGYNLDRVAPGRPQHGAAAGRLRGHARLLQPRSSCELQPLPAAPGARRLPFPDLLPGDGRRPRHIVELGPSAVELVDRTILELAAQIPALPAADRALRARRARMRSCWSSSPATSRTSSSTQPAASARADGRSRLCRTAWCEATEPAAQARIWEVRKAGLNIVMSMKGDGKPVSFIEDCAVPLEHLADYTDAPDRAVRPARHERHLVRARLGRLPACAADPQPEAGEGRQGDARDRRGGVRDGARVQGRPFRRARRRPGALRVPRGDVRRPRWCAPSRRSRTRSTRRACSTPARSCGAPRMDDRSAVPLPAGLSRRCRSRPRSTGRPGAVSSAPPRCATTTAPAARPSPA